MFIVLAGGKLFSEVCAVFQVRKQVNMICAGGYTHLSSTHELSKGESLNLVDNSQTENH